MASLDGKEILLGVTGGIAAYKAVELTSRLVKLRASVSVIMTQNATKMIAPRTFQSISRNSVTVDMFAEIANWQPGHVSLADKADIFVIAPATANSIAKLAHGIADDMLSTTALAVRAPILIAPAMNCHMYENSVLQNNIKILKEYGVSFIEPEHGRLACGYEGKGRLADIDKIVQAIKSKVNDVSDLERQTVLVTAGPTREPLDPIRFITNRSTGKMGYAVAEAAVARGANVILVSGPTALSAPEGVKLIDIETTAQMRDGVFEYANKSDVIVLAAAPVDYRPQNVSSRKIKKQQGDMTLALERTPDAMAELGRSKMDSRIVVGFSMETENLLENARQKLLKKNADLIVANDISQKGAGFGTDTNVVWLINSSGQEKKLPLMSKRDVADAIFDEVISIRSSLKQ